MADRPVHSASMAAQPSTFEIRLLRRDADESCTDEAVVIIDGRDRLASLGRDAAGRDGFGAGTVWIGRRPEDVMGTESPLLAREEPHDAFIARCGCGEEGCGALIARITHSGDVVIWDRIRHGSDAREDERPIDGERFEFEAHQYEDAVHGRGEPITPWTPTTRRAAVLVRHRVKSWRGEEHRLRVAGVEDLGDERVRLTMVLGHKGEPDCAVLTRTFRLDPGESAAALANRVTSYLTSGAIVDDELAERRPF
jgi:hypothetical protein